jgi:hypothetical protein
LVSLFSSFLSDSFSLFLVVTVTFMTDLTPTASS